VQRHGGERKAANRADECRKAISANFCISAIRFPIYNHVLRNCFRGPESLLLN